MKKEVLLLALIFVILFSSFSSAEIANESAKKDKAYDCLKNQIDDRTCAKLSSEEKIFSLLAAGECGSEVDKDAKGNECWPSSGCTIKATAQAIMALNGNNDKAEKWLLSQNKTPSNIDWYLQVESTEATSCEISFASGSYNLELSEEKKIISSSGRCFSKTQEDYWLKISDSCLKEEFTISCDNGFLTNLIYKERGSDVFYISSETSSAAADGETIEKINSFCFGVDKCDYEGSLWAALALSGEQGDEIENFLPYLLTNAEDNDKFLPESFLYFLTEDSEYRSLLLSKQKPQGYWLESNSNKFYDTALALLPFSGEQDFSEKTKAKEWLISTQGTNGCWENNIRNTAFILFSVWPKSVSSGGGGSTKADCEASDYSCRSATSCTQDGGNVLDDYSCVGTKKCCDVEEVLETCRELSGIVCSSSEECESGTEANTASDLGTGETCCVGGTCEEVVVPFLGCESINGNCRSSCLSNEDISSELCEDPSDDCCIPGPEPTSNYLWVWILSGLILLILLGILFRNKLRLFFLRFKGGKSRQGPSMPPRMFPPPTMPTMIRRPMQRRILPPQPVQPQRRPLPVKPKEENKELDDVLKKLKEIGK
jgi:hypothetical protein